MRTSNPASVARFSSVSVIASGFAKLLFKSEIADWRSLSPNELIICSVLGVVVTHYVFEHFPSLPEGQLSEVRAGVVNARVLAEVRRVLAPLWVNSDIAV